VEARQRERRVVVVEDRASPAGRRVAGVARGREVGSGVCWIGGAVVIGHVAAGAEGGQRAVVGGCRRVALHALHGRVEARQRE